MRLNKICLALVTTITLGCGRTFAPVANAAQVSDIVAQIKKNSGIVDLELAEDIVTISDLFDLDARLVAAIMAQESMYKTDAQAGNDYGIMQINIKNIESYELDKDRLLTDRRYAIWFGVKILKYFETGYVLAEPRTWWCRYNVGTGVLKGGRLKACREYVRKVMRFY